MSTRTKVPWLLSLLLCALFAVVAILPQDWSAQLPSSWEIEADAGMRKNASGQVVCAHLTGTAGGDHATGTVTVSYHNNTSFVSDGTATYNASGVWCYTLSADATNYDLSKVLWTSTGMISLLQTYATTGFDESLAYIPANVMQVNGTATTATLDSIAAQVTTNTGHLTSTVYGLETQHTNQTNIMGSGFLTSTDSLEAIRNRGDVAWTTGAGAAADKAYVPSAGPTVTQPTTGGYVVGDYTALAHVNGTYLTVREEGSANPGMDFYLTFAGDAGVIPAALAVWGYYSGNVSHNIRVQAGVSGGTSEWEDIGTISNGTAVALYTFPLTAQHINATSGAANVRFLHNAVAGVSSHYLYLDKLLFEAATAVSTAPDAATVAAEVWNTTAASHTASTIMGGVLNAIGPHLIGTLGAGMHDNSTALIKAIDEKHGPGPWVK